MNEFARYSADRELQFWLANPIDFGRVSAREAVAGLIIGLRTALDMTQEEFAEKTGKSRSLISRWESGQGNARVESLGELLAAFNQKIVIGSMDVGTFVTSGIAFREGLPGGSKPQPVIRVILSTPVEDRVLTASSEVQKRSAEEINESLRDFVGLLT